MSESNPTGDSQIGEAKTVPFTTPGHDGVPGGTEFTYLQIKDNNVADQFFEFAANNTKVEFGQDRFSFSDGYSTNIIGTNHSTNENANSINVLNFTDISEPGSSSRHFINNATQEERVHSHPPGSEWAPSGFNAYRDRKTGKVITETGLNAGDRKNYDNRIKNMYQYTPGVGYFRYNNKTATHTGNKKN
ncbi:JAB-like toxin 1 domain-containing protein [Chryseobacterium sp. T9W2-O]|uniref:JAB-like toxin 1 domain-containing protein n=1 Tax=Chryseobacterium salviniae TaxID=3101750 RepID=A0ABU6HN06_9FLAO|nr:JAB-like toxin 1 domain-containing protein [Chryseobacterium sp. T9W2-O]MEC3874446.1 JAB-like toxin 1 domain-containing protein [Chryseobacterium sp. T9W2-O]